jgi:hypothetical protein
LDEIVSTVDDPRIDERGSACSHLARKISWSGRLGFATLLAIHLGAQLTSTLFEHTFYVLLAALAAGAVRTPGAEPKLS